MYRDRFTSQINSLFEEKMGEVAVVDKRQVVNSETEEPEVYKKRFITVRE